MFTGFFVLYLRCAMKKQFLFLIFIFSLTGFQPADENQDLHISITPLTKDVYVHTSYNMYEGEAFPSNGLVVVTEKSIVLLDSPWTEAQTQELIDSLEKKHGKKVTHCIATHFHADRTAGFDVLKKHGTQTWSSKQTYYYCTIKGEKRAEFTFEKDTVFNVDGLTIETFYPGKGHAPDNIVVWIPSKKILHGGCFVKSVETTGLGNLSDATPALWKTSVEVVMEKYKNPRYIIPGHFGWKSRKALKHTRKLLLKYKPS